MPKEEKKVKFVHPGFNPTNFASATGLVKGNDFTKGTRLLRHLERKGNGVTIVDDGIEDFDALIQSEKNNAGLENIMRLQTMRYGTIENAIARNKDKQMYADVSHIPTSISEQADYVKDIQSDVDNLCAKLGISKDELLKANQQFLSDKLAELNKTANAVEGSNE